MNDLPDISFVNKDVEGLLSEKIKGYEDAYFEQTGERKTLYPGDPIRIFLYSQALREYHLLLLIDYSAKQNLLKYAEGIYLEHKAADRNVIRLSASKATVPVKFTFSAPLSSPAIINAGTRVTPGNNIFFKTTDNIEVPSGATEIIIIMECTEAGTIGNDYIPGQIGVLVDPIPFVDSIINIERSQGGADTEGDESLRERAWLAPESYSVAGPAGAYIFWAKQYSPSILDVKATSPSPGVVDIRVILEGGEIPEAAFLEGLEEYLSDIERRPLTDNVQVNQPGTVNYDLNVTYYVSVDNQTVLDNIRDRVEKVVQDYVLWQKSKMGRDINPDQLIYMLKEAGAKRVEVSTPVYTVVNETDIAICGETVLTYGGLEND